MASSKNLIFITFIAYSIFIFSSFSSPIEGVHQTRQADTLFAAYSYCMENSSFLFPKIIHRENTPGVSIGEFPLFSWLISVPCQLTGIWNDQFPKVFSFTFLLLNILVWWQVLLGLLRRKIESAEYTHEFATFFALFFFSSLALEHYLIPIPDGLALLLAGTSALSFQKKFRGWILFSAALMIFSFAIRPYLAPLFLFLIPYPYLKPARKTLKSYLPLLLATAGSLAFYFWWYRSWTQHSDLLYYNTSRTPLPLILQQLPEILKGLEIQILRAQWNYVGLLLLTFAILIQYNRQRFFQFENAELRRQLSVLPWWSYLRNFLIAAVLSLLFVVSLKGDHFARHGYYLSAQFIFLIFAQWFALQMLTKKWKNAFLLVYILIGIINTQHLFWRQTEPIANRIQNLVQARNVAAEEKIVTYLGSESNTTYFLYFAKRTGWAWAETDTDQPCPAGAHWKLFKDENSEIQMDSCKAP